MFGVNLVWITNELVLPLTDALKSNLKIGYEVIGDILKLIILIEAVLILSEYYELSSKFVERQNFIFLEFSDVFEHFRFFGLESVVLDRFHDIIVVIRMASFSVLDWRILGTEHIGTSLHINLNLVFDLFDFHQLAF